MATLSSLPRIPSGVIRTVPPQPRDSAVVMPGFIGTMAFVCGAGIAVKLDVVGEVFLLEPLLALLALQCLLSRGAGRYMVPSIYLRFVAAGLVTFCGYLIADLVAANEPWQYLKGWGRVGFLVLDCAAIMLIAAHGRQHLWWMALGVAAGGIVLLAWQGVPPTKWKLGYGEYAAFLICALASLAPLRLAMMTIAAFAVVCLVADYRSLGGICMLVAALIWWRPASGRKLRVGWWRTVAAVLLGIVTIAGLLALTEERFADRRQQSNVGRYAGILVAWDAIAESPFLGYGSWAADERYARMLRNEAARLNQGPSDRMELGRSLLPHSQFLQAWIEGGLAGIAFFLVYAWGIARALRWYGWMKPPDLFTPLFLLIIVGGAWNLLASPFLGVMRIYIAMTAGTILIAEFELRRMARTVRTSHDARHVRRSTG